MTTIPASLLDTVTTGDARELARLLPDESVDAIVTDPPYPEEFNHLWTEMGEWAPRVLKPGGSLVTLCGHQQVRPALDGLRALKLHWCGWLVNHGSKPTLFGARVVCGGKPMLWLSKGRPAIDGFWWDTQMSGAKDKRFHEWGQREEWASRNIQQFSPVGGVVLEPFTGGGTVPAVCKQLGRRYVAFEIDAPTAERARQRIHDTQIPLFIPEPAPPPALCFDAEEVTA